MRATFFRALLVASCASLLGAGCPQGSGSPEPTPTGPQTHDAGARVDAGPGARDAGPPPTDAERCADTCGEHRACVIRNGEPQCGACRPGYHALHSTCVLVYPSCELAPCTENHRACTTEGGETFCGECIPGYKDVDGTCVRDGDLSCANEYLREQCQLRHRVCVEDDQGALCGGCADGFRASGDSCVSHCLARDCAGQNRTCHANPTEDACGSCREGYREGEGGACVRIQTCANLNCQPPGVCVQPNPAEDATCTPTPCADNSAWVASTGTCVPCSFNAPGGGLLEGCAAGHYPAAAGNGSCVCRVQPGYYWESAAGFHRPLRCDADNDGWASASAVVMFNSGDPTLRQAAADGCQFRTVHTVELVNDHGQTLSLPTNDSRLGAPTMTEVILVESMRNDRQDLLTQAQASGQVGVYPGVTAAVVLRAADLNPLTKFCVDRTSDFNDDGTADLFEQQYLPRAQNAEDFFRKLAFFAELGTYTVADGKLIISERPRGAGLPISYHLPGAFENCTNGEDDDGDGAADCADDACLQTLDCTDSVEGSGVEDCLNGADDDADGVADCRDTDCASTHHCGPNYWQECPRFRDSLFDDRGVPEKVGTDFAQFSPAFNQVFDRSQPHWRGMNHASQFKCLDVHETLPTLASALHVNTKAVTEVFSSASLAQTRPYAPNRCLLSAAAHNGTTPGFTCTAQQTPVTGAMWGAVGYRNGLTSADGYLNGCANECAVTLEHIIGPGVRCPGFSSFAPVNSAHCLAQERRFGKQSCGNYYCAGGSSIAPGWDPTRDDSYWVCRDNTQTMFGSPQPFAALVDQTLLVMTGWLQPNPRTNTTLHLRHAGCIEKYDDGTPCGSNADCSGTCEVVGRCQIPDEGTLCSSSADCLGVCIGRRCTSRDSGKACSTNAECGAGETCQTVSQCVLTNEQKNNLCYTIR
ncbi:MAG: hypothetical protein AB2A00_22630 [Myxococcota bacterium]